MNFQKTICALGAAATMAGCNVKETKAPTTPKKSPAKAEVVLKETPRVIENILHFCKMNTADSTCNDIAIAWKGARIQLAMKANNALNDAKLCHAEAKKNPDSGYVCPDISAVRADIAENFSHTPEAKKAGDRAQIEVVAKGLLEEDPAMQSLAQKANDFYKNKSEE